MLRMPRVVWMMLCVLMGAWLLPSPSIMAGSHESMSHSRALASESLHAGHHDELARPDSDASSTLDLEYLDCIDHCTLAVLPSFVEAFSTLTTYWPLLASRQPWLHHFPELVTPPPRTPTFIVS
ncbi:hypothetical protein HGG82_12965 [Marinomonas sp. M1K-6]|uniref:Uncharacterized protein n=1 Tax=Marinomonas profundi TaxID=2726122 RepID=A0A847QZ49_9GAMM|nr:hypothetical protein [Marinomonas profundi]NLQ18519.1 hypothetical protein [Marinomonas profundi]UDV04392.1 hypothetical protein J8N69_06470 [Marinomonas profundi]